MATQTIERSVQRTAADLEARFPGRFLSVTSFKRDGTGVPGSHGTFNRRVLRGSTEEHRASNVRIDSGNGFGFEGGEFPVAEEVGPYQIFTRQIGEARDDQTPRGVAPGLQPPPPPDRDHLGQDQLQDHPLHAHEQAEQEDQGEHGDNQRLAAEEPARERHA